MQKMTCRKILFNDWILSKSRTGYVIFYMTNVPVNYGFYSSYAGLQIFTWLVDKE